MTEGVKHLEAFMHEPYQILVEGGEAETELKKSRFIATVAPVATEAEAVSFVNSIKKKYYDARHNCYAYVIGKDDNCIKFSDDGEPSQTAGQPIYNVIQKSHVKNVCIVVTRYFGGTLLGAGPLTRMYVEAATLGLAASGVAWMRYGAEVDITTDYPDGEKVRRFAEKEGYPVVDIKYGANVVTSICTDFDRFDDLCKSIVSLTASRAKIEKKNESYFIDKRIN